MFAQTPTQTNRRLAFDTQRQHGLPIRCHSPFGMKLVMSPLLLPLDSWRSIPLMSYVHDPNFISHNWSSNGNHVMSILHVLRKSPGGTQRQLPLDDTTTFVGNVLSMSSSALCIWIQNSSGKQHTILRDSWDSLQKSGVLYPKLCNFISFHTSQLTHGMVYIIIDVCYMWS